MKHLSEIELLRNENQLLLERISLLEAEIDRENKISQKISSLEAIRRQITKDQEYSATIKTLCFERYKNE